MPATVRQADICTGHGCWSPRPNVSWSNNVFINDLGAHRTTDAWSVHCCLLACHGSSMGAGSPNVYVNDLQQARIGDPVLCGSVCATGSPNVFAND